MISRKTDQPFGLSIVIPVYNSAEWITETLTRIFASARESGFEVEIVVVDDGSSDGSAQIAGTLEVPDNIELRIISQKNSGRYLARKTGIEATHKDGILFIDSRVYIDAPSLPFLYDQLKENQDQIWNGHVRIDKKGNVFARFWDAITCIVWRRYFSNPRPVQYGLEEYDYYPKGTGFFYVPRARLMPALEYFEEATNDLRNSSDDTLLIRFLNERQDIHLSPEFSCLYHGRSNARDFLSHAYHRGQFFVDGFLRPGTRFYYPLIGFLVGSVTVFIVLLLWPEVLLPLSAVGGAVLLASFVVIMLLGIEVKDAASLVLLAPVFSIVYGLGIWKATFKRLTR